MTLRRDGFYGVVVCDGCRTEHHTTETNLILAFHDATVRHGWTGHSDIPHRIRGRARGVFCPDCVQAMHDRLKDRP